MPNIVYVLTNPAMPDIVKIGMTDREDVQRRMAELYSTGVPFPFDCVIARQIEVTEAAKVESALHTAFGPHRINPSREFFKIDPEQVAVLLQVMPGQDVTPRISEEIAALQPEDLEAASEYKRRQDRTDEGEFLESLNENGIRVYERVLALGKKERMHTNWGRKGFSLNVVSNGAKVLVCKGYPPSAFHQQIFTDFAMIRRKTNVPQGVIETLRQDGLDTGLFVPMGSIGELSCQTDRKLDETQLTAITGWLEVVIAKIREYENVDSNEDISTGVDVQ